jgi:hypothetical protein
MSRIDAILLVLLLVSGLGWLIAARNWPGARQLRRLWRRGLPRVREYVRRSPATFVYGAILFVTTWVVAGVAEKVSDELLRSQSTNLENLRTNSVSVLLRSMFWTGSTWLLPLIAALVLVLAPAEVWLGTKRVILVFLTGHIGATLITALAISQGYFAEAGGHVDRDIDVGLSYGALCVIGLFAYRLPPRWRIPYALMALAPLAVLAFGNGRTFTDFGHVVSLLLGFALYPVARGRPVVEPLRVPLLRRWKATAVRLRRPQASAE